MTNEELIQEIKSNQDVQSNMYLLYSQNMTLIKQWSSKYIRHCSSEDILQECYIALHQAVQSFALNKGYKFTTYLQKCIITHLSRQLGDYTGVKLSDDDKKLLMEYISLNNKQQQVTGESISNYTACCKLNCSEQQLNRIKQYISLNNSRSLDGPTGEEMSMLEILSDNTNIEQEYEERETDEHSGKLWNLVNNALDERSAKVIISRYKDGKTLIETGKEDNSSIENVRTIQNKSLKKLRINKDIKQFANDYYGIALHYGYNSWKNNRCSAVEYAVELMECRRPKPSDYNDIEKYIEADLKYQEQRFNAIMVQKR